ncbi:hypothetical protein [Arthrobacter sp. CJ23]|uniref:hypothetical protein n=1 Tax=Arthrobacter sp. CJ23 TaxID=2972479 RepID=UPI00215C9466|nr:hypothetical protein [Arthrobacter sp. CJ23]UVJ38067.1 hypothetical protein NVV90_12430 [Arthrobacter sp. CJ23]
MTTPTNDAQANVKKLGIQLEPDMHAQLTLIAQLQGSTLTDEIRKALTAHVASVKAGGDLATHAEAAMAEIERDAAARREAISSLFGTPTQASDKPHPARTR